jgi:hypothetical protein
VEGVMQSAEAFAAGAPPQDDVTVFVGRIQDAMVEEPRWEAESVAVAVAA